MRLGWGADVKRRQGNNGDRGWARIIRCTQEDLTAQSCILFDQTRGYTRHCLSNKV